MLKGPSPKLAARMLGLVRAAHDERLAARAVKQGLLSQEQIETCRIDDSVASLSQDLVKRGFLTDEQVSVLEGEIAQEDFLRPSTSQTAALPPEAEAAAAASDGRPEIDGFVAVKLLGRGGAGVVWKAWDVRLGRWVAVKLSAAALESQAARQRFEREAAAAARLDHPNILPVYQFGATDGRPFLVMPLVEGRNLEGDALPLPQALETLRLAALAVEYAHGHGIVHRDIKPANIMLDGQGRVFVIDFGLVYMREDAAAATRPGDVLGTAAYMSPEQARGDPEAREPATDVYGLGATLYRCTTGSAPFVGGSFAEIVAQVISGRPVPPRRLLADLPLNLEIVIAKAMHPDPRRRYRSAGALAEDLGHLIEKREIVARAESGLGPLLRRRLMVGAVVVAAVALAFGVRASVEAKRSAAERALQSLALASLDTALRLRRSGDHAALKRLQLQIEAAYDAAGGGAQAPEIEYLKGRLYRALLSGDEALACQERALARAPNLAPALYERAVLLSRRYGRLLQDALASARVLDTDAISAQTALAIPSPLAADVERTRPELVSLRDRILGDLRHLQRVGTDVLGGSARALAVAGILAYHRGATAEALTLLTQAVDQDPFLEEAWETLGAAYEADQQHAAAEGAYSRGLSHDRGYLPFVVARCLVRVRQSRHKAALADATAVLRLEPGMNDARLCGANARLYLAVTDGMAGFDPLADLATAEGDLDQVINQGGPSAQAHYVRGGVHRARACFIARRGMDPSAALDSAERDFTAAIGVEPDNTLGWGGRGRTRGNRAIHLIDSGVSASAALDAAWLDLTEALRLDKRRAATWQWRGEVSLQRARLRFLEAADRGSDLKQAAEDFDEGVRISPRDPWARYRRAGLRLLVGVVRAAGGEDPSTVWAEADDDLDQALPRLRSAADLWTRKATVRMARALFRLSQAESPGSALTDAAQDLSRALKIDPGFAEAKREHARLLLVMDENTSKQKPSAKSSHALKAHLRDALENLLVPTP